MEKRVWLWQVARYKREGWKSCWQWETWHPRGSRPPLKWLLRPSIILGFVRPGHISEMIRPWIVSPNSKYYGNW